MVKDNIKRIDLRILSLGGLICSLVAGYFYYVSLAPAPDNQAQLQALLRGSGRDKTPSTEAANPADGQTDKTPGKPSTDASKVEFNNKLANPAPTTADTIIQKTANKDFLPPARLAPDMFSFSSLPNNAPMAEFPITLVGQKNLEWYKTRTGPEGGVDAGIQSSVYGRPPGLPPGPLPGPPGPPEPPIPPVPPGPKPPPEVSTSGL